MDHQRQVKRWGAGLLGSLVLVLQAACGGGSSGGGAESGAQAAAATLAKPLAVSSVGLQAPAGELQAATAVRSATGQAGAGDKAMPASSAVRFLAQASFGATDAEVQNVQKLWRHGWLQQQFAMPQGQSYWDRVKAGQVAWANEEPGRLPEKAPASITDAAIWQSYVTSPDQLRKRVGYALSQILVTSMEGFSSGSGGNGLLGAGYLDVLERHAFGNYRDLLKDVTLNPAMGYYLSIKNNQKADAKTGRVPDENYAREVMQLFTIGLVELDSGGQPKPGPEPGTTIPTYTQDTVTQLARVFTGWNWDRSGAADEQFRKPMLLRAGQSSPEDVEVFGQTYSLKAAGHTPATRLDWALDLLFNHPNTGPFVGKQLIQRLVTSNPSPDYVARVSAKFNDNGAGVRGDMKAVIDQVLRDPEALMAESGPPSPAWGKLREPVLRFTQLARHLGMSATTPNWPIGNLSDPALGLGQSPMRSPSVFNFYRPGYVPPKTKFAALGAVAPEFQITTDVSVPGYVNFVHRFMAKPPKGTVLDYSRDTALAGNATELVARLNLMLSNNAMAAGTVSRIVSAVNALPAGDAKDLQTRAQTALLLTLAAPETITLK